MNVIQQFIGTVSKYGKETAITWNDKEYTFDEIDRKSDYVAGYLTSKGFSAIHVGCAMQRSYLWPIALLGLLKARCSYTPLDLANPKLRIQQIIDDAEIGFVITDDACTMSFDNVPFVNISDIIAEKVCAELPGIEMDDLAYIFYTSGTTGQPKGIPATHRQLGMASAYWMPKVFHAAPGERVLQMAGMNFHVSMMEAITLLVGGAHLCIISDEEKKDPQLIVNFLNRNRIKRGFIAPALLSLLPHVELPYLKTIIVAGESCPKNVRDYWIQDHDIVNTYGSTETSVCIGSYIQDIDDEVNNVGPVNPLLESYIVDENLEPVPDGAAGELCIGGPSVTTGYLNRPQLNADKFIKNIYSDKPGHCPVLYRTGDYVEKTPDGKLLHKGRIDDQVKIKGVRIETKEIEIALESHPGVEKAVVAAKEVNKSKKLVAYVKLKEDIKTEAIRTFLSDMLPAFMCPTLYVKMDSFPVNINNKVMRNQLPDPVAESVEADRSQWSKTEIQVADMISEVLLESPQSVDDSFWSLGGDSLSIMQLAGLIEKRFRIHVRVSDIQQGPTVRSMAAFIDEKKKTIPQEYTCLNETSDKVSLPLSLKDLWRECQMSDEINGAYQFLFEFDYPEEIDISLLERAWNIFLECQEAMRLTFYLEGNDVYGKIRPYAYERFVLSEGQTAGSFFDQVKNKLQPDSRQLYRVQLSRRKDGGYSLLVAIHHLITDGLSYPIIGQQLSEIYKALQQGGSIKPQVVSYREYLEWKLNSDSTDVGQKQAFWKDYLEQLPPLSIPLSSVGKQENAGILALNMSQESCYRLKLFCQKHQVTVTHVMLSVYGYVVGKYLNQSDYVIGVASTDREEVRFLNTAGYMVSMLPLRTLSRTDERFSSSVEAMKQSLLAAQRHAMPLSDLLVAANISNGNYFMRIAYAIENDRLDVLLNGVNLKEPPFPLVLYAGQTADELNLALQYSRSYFSDNQIESLAHCLVHVLDELMTHPENSLNQCPMVSVTESSDTSDTSAFPTVVERFLDIAHEYPQWTAYRYKGQDYSYGILNEMSASFYSVMEELKDNDPSRHIGVCLNDRKYLLPIIMGILRRGDCYVPIDTALPEKRMRHIIEDARLSYIITDVEISELKDEVTLLSLDPKWFERRDRHFVEQMPSRDSTAYIIFTSGSTGKPKGIPISQANLAVYCSNFVNLTKMRAGMRVLQYASLGFDASVLEMFPALSAGATVVFPEAEQKTSPELLLSFFENEHIALSLIPPSLLAILPYRELPDLETLLVGGEATPKDVQDKWRHGRTLINAYGPTENTVMATAMIMDDKTAYNNIGYPLPGVNCYVMDENRRILPDYAIGELYISGAQLTSGYLNNDEQNRLHFFSNPYDPNRILYRSGDMVMRTSDGSFLFLGRVDSQMKVHGFRIEVSEIIKVLENIPDIRQAYVTVRKETADATLIAYCIREEGSSIAEQEVLDIISNILPHYMVPSALMFIKEFPLNQNNKIDVSRLPINSPDSLMVPPSTADETIIEKAVCELLHKEHISVIANLFSEGLTSILAMVLIGVLKEQGLNYSYSDIYRYRTICELARHGQSKTWYWHSFSSSKPVVILVCGFTPVLPFYDEYIGMLAEKYSILVFEAFPVYYATQQQKAVDAQEYVDFMLQIVRQQMNGLNFSVFAVTGHSLGSELGLLLAERLRMECCPDIRVLAIGTSLYKDNRLDTFLGEKNTMLSQMLSSVPTIHFEGDLRVALENKPSSSVILSGEADPEFEKFSEIHISKNNQLWKSTYPTARILMLDTSHFDLLQTQYLPQLMSLLDK